MKTQTSALTLTLMSVMGVVTALPLLGCTSSPKQCDPVGCSGTVAFTATVAPTQGNDFSLEVCRNTQCAKTPFRLGADASQTVALASPHDGALVVSAGTVRIEIRGGEGAFAQGDVWKLTLLDVTRSATLLQVTSTPTAYRLDEPAGAGCGGCLSATLVAR